jgi:hypothetical protein
MGILPDYKPQPTVEGREPALTLIRMHHGHLAPMYPGKVHEAKRVEVDHAKGEVHLVFSMRRVDFTTYERMAAGIEQDAPIEAETAAHPKVREVAALLGEIGQLGPVTTKGLEEAIAKATKLIALLSEMRDVADKRPSD